MLQSFLRFAGAHKDEMTESEMDDLGHTLYASCWNLRFLQEDKASLRRLYQILGPGFEYRDGRKDSLVDPTWGVKLSWEFETFQRINNHPKVKRNYDLIVRNAFYHTLFRTGSGSLGLALHPIRNGDEIAIVGGCQQPLVLRRQNNDDFKLVGLAYVCEMMDGSR